MSVTCPDGHQSVSTDFCDVCGAPIVAASVPGVTGPEPAESKPAESKPAESKPAEPTATAVGPDPAAAVVCPTCGTVVSADSLFCEGCGRDMVTGQMPATSGTGTAAEQVPPVRASTGWVAEVWVDEEWFAARGEGRCPTVGEPRTFVVDDGALIGRVSKSRHLVPEVDCSADGAVSSRQAVLGHQGTFWTVTDLGSTNGTFIGHAGDPLPVDPIAPNEPVELETGDRILMGAHTRVVIRAESPGEVGQGSP